GSGSTQSVDVQQAYVEYLADIGDGVSLTFGKQATLIGAEVIESMDNWNYSRSYLFGLAIPFTHTGFRASYPLSETVGIAMGVNNGWDIANDTNIGKGLEGQVAWAPTDEFSISLQGMYSPEGSTTLDNADRWIADIVASYQATDDLALMLNYDFGYEEDNESIGENAGWQGIGLYAKYTLSDTWSLAGRYEFFRDYDGFRAAIPTFSGPVAATSGTTDVTLQEFTLTSEHLIGDRLIARLEYRHDLANAQLFGHDDSGLQNYQDTMAVELILPF
ncbi:MAG: outer membrane beta-barrel protein, partial [Gemmatimonadales bacterium]